MVRILLVLPMFLLVMVTAMHGQVAAAKPAEDSWKSLETEPSRADLFKATVHPPRSANGSQTFVFPISFQFPTSAEKDVNGTARTNSWFGIDISHHNGPNFPIELLRRQMVAFVYTKATQGTHLADKTFGKRWAAMKAEVKPLSHVF